MSSVRKLTAMIRMMTFESGGVHGDEDGAAGVKSELHPLELELLDVVRHHVLDRMDLLRHHGEHAHVNPKHRLTNILLLLQV